jgi:hypothetical protein
MTTERLSWRLFFYRALVVLSTIALLIFFFIICRGAWFMWMAPDRVFWLLPGVEAGPIDAHEQSAASRVGMTMLFGIIALSWYCLVSGWRGSSQEEEEDEE